MHWLLFTIFLYILRELYIESHLLDSSPSEHSTSMCALLRHFQHISAGDLLLFCEIRSASATTRTNNEVMKRTHQIENGGQLLQWHLLERSVDESTCEEIHGLVCVLSVTHVAAPNVDHLHHGVENRSLEVGVCRHADQNNGAGRSEILNGL